MVRDEADIVGRTIEHLFAQGLDGIIVADNGSTDETPDILESLAADRPVYVTKDDLVAYHQGPKMTMLARWAADAGADWIVPFDADEWWFGRSATVAEQLRSSGAMVQRATMYNLFPLSSEPGNSWRLDLTRSSIGKVAFRWHPTARLTMGNHQVVRAGERADDLLIAHLPWRSFAQFERKALQGREALDAAAVSSGKAGHWRSIASLERREVEARWNDLLNGRLEMYSWGQQGPFATVELSALEGTKNGLTNVLADHGHDR